MFKIFCKCAKWGEQRISRARGLSLRAAANAATAPAAWPWQVAGKMLKWGTDGRPRPCPFETGGASLRGRGWSPLSAAPFSYPYFLLLRLGLNAGGCQSSELFLKWKQLRPLTGFVNGLKTPNWGVGTPSGARTLDTLIKSQVLYQLS